MPLQYSGVANDHAGPAGSASGASWCERLGLGLGLGLRLGLGVGGVELRPLVERHREQHAGRRLGARRLRHLVRVRVRLTRLGLG